ncbi:hypothetical protein ANCCEY_11718 [Ancylostoma ceylanicum]|uniref:Tyr recombinase domain-containing protein n=1 Tax=Ancylostoma ceylanicum TaxID=53326 RepID=A0A0D6LD50_9BILA|nr:hypothetical protein ANCCEY_11718 [Ancylostoma ceylanicum]
MITESMTREQTVRRLQTLAREIHEDVEDTLENLLTNSRAPNTVAVYSRKSEEFRNWQRNYPAAATLHQLDSAAIFIAKKSITSSAKTLATFVAALAFSRMGKKPQEAEKWTILDEMVRSKRRMEPIKEQNFATSEEWLVLLDATVTVNWPPWRIDRALILLTLLYCGLLRISEAVNMGVEDVTEEEQAWKCQIRRAKNDQYGSGTAVYLAKEPWFDDVLRRHKNLRRSGQLLSTGTGRRWSEGAAASEIRRLCEAANIRIKSLTHHRINVYEALR